MRPSRFLTIAPLLLGSCTTDTALPVSQGLKIFVTSRIHGGDFANDPYLAGANAIEKADAFCDSDPAKPSAASYKALIVDGVNRDAKTLVNWVLKPSTDYYQTHGDVLIGTTTAASIFGAVYMPLANPVVRPASPITGSAPPSEVWTGIASAADFSSGDDCNGWSDLASAYAWWARPTETNGLAFSAALAGCGIQWPIYCVEQ